MEFLFTRLALHLRAAGFASMSSGMAPLSGLAPTPLASVWHRIGRLLWAYGSRLYSFRGLRSFKGKFHPVWEPRYLATSGLLGPILTLAAVAAARRTRAILMARAVRHRRCDGCTGESGGEPPGDGQCGWPSASASPVSA